MRDVAAANANARRVVGNRSLRPNSTSSDSSTGRVVAITRCFTVSGAQTGLVRIAAKITSVTTRELRSET